MSGSGVRRRDCAGTGAEVGSDGMGGSAEISGVVKQHGGEQETGRRERISLTRAYQFCAAHRLHTSALPDDVNQKVYGKCNNPHGHGHNYTVLVTVEVDWDPQEGLRLDLSALDHLVRERIVARFDHRHLNHDPAFTELVPTGENLARIIWEELVHAIPTGRLKKIGLVETRDNVFEYVGAETRIPTES
ncbi:MAG: 6-pyruvoyl tetrahydrobiopterin synthase [Nitrospirae bacterium]|nr:MAG: 6-pyruvoyl tetrahydrobiopterin synthase [Nitrospirota bacterium]